VGVLIGLWVLAIMVHFGLSLVTFQTLTEFIRRSEEGD
jgi:hypothetical protein